MGGRFGRQSCKTPYSCIYEIPVTDIDGLAKSMAEFRNQVLLVVNVATQ
jgi:glutathione peroxidase-family protein